MVGYWAGMLAGLRVERMADLMVGKKADMMVESMVESWDPTRAGLMGMR